MELNDIVEVYDYVPREDVFRYMKNTDILLLIIGAGKDDTKISTGKLFEYMGSGNIILALIPSDGIAAKVIKETNTGIVVNPNDITEIKKAIMSLLDSKQKNYFSVNPNKEIKEKYNMKIITREFSEILNQITE